MTGSNMESAALDKIERPVDDRRLKNEQWGICSTPSTIAAERLEDLDQ